jgi:hypothetical protein
MFSPYSISALGFLTFASENVSEWSNEMILEEALSILVGGVAEATD